MSRPRISVVTVSFNEGDGLCATMESVLAQTWRPLEYIIVDGGSTDGSYGRAMEALTPRAAETGIGLKAVSERDRGIYDGMNKGAAMAEGEWIIFMNAGDTFYDSGVIERFFGAEDVGDAAIVYGDFERVKAYGTVECRALPPEMIAESMPTSHQAMFIRTELMRKYPYDLSFRIVADYNFVYGLNQLGYRIVYRPGKVARCEAVKGVTSRTRVSMHKECDRVRGIALTPGRRLRYALKSAGAVSRRMFDSLVPQKLLLAVKRLNRRRLDRHQRKARERAGL